MPLCARACAEHKVGFAPIPPRLQIPHTGPACTVQAALVRGDRNVLVDRISPFSYKLNTMDLPITSDQVLAYLSGRVLLQDAFPQLTLSLIHI